MGDGNVFIEGIKVNQEDLGKDQEATLEENVEKEVTLIKADNTSFLEKLIEKFIIK